MPRRPSRAAEDLHRNIRTAHVLYRTLIVSGKYRVADVAETVGIAPSTLYGWCENYALTPAWAFPGFYRATHDIEFISDLANLQSVGLVVSRNKEAGASAGSVAEATLQLGQRLGGLQAAVAAAIADGVITDDERIGLAKMLGDLKRSIAEIEAMLQARTIKLVGGSR